MANVGAGQTEPVIRTAKQTIGGSEVGGLHLNAEMQFTLMIIIFALVSLLFLYLIARSGRATPFFLRIYLITIIVFGTIAVVSSAYATEQIAPVVGLFGTIAGYVLGKSDRPNEAHTPESEAPPAPQPSGAGASPPTSPNTTPG